MSSHISTLHKTVKIVIWHTNWRRRCWFIIQPWVSINPYLAGSSSCFILDGSSNIKMGCTKIQSGIHTDNPICPWSSESADLLCLVYSHMNWEGQRRRRKSLHFFSLQMWKLLWEKTFFSRGVLDFFSRHCEWPLRYKLCNEFAIKQIFNSRVIVV